MKLKFYILTVLVIVATVALMAQESIINSFTARSDGKNVTLEWKTSIESNVSHFEIERAPVNGTFKYLDTEKANGYPSNYSYKDDNVFKKEDGSDVAITSNNFLYRIKIVKKDYKYEYSNNVNVVHNISGIQKTWGMIKEMFR